MAVREVKECMNLTANCVLPCVSWIRVSWFYYVPIIAIHCIELWVRYVITCFEGYIICHYMPQTVELDWKIYNCFNYRTTGSTESLHQLSRQLNGLISEVGLQNVTCRCNEIKNWVFLIVCHRLYWVYWHEKALFCVYKQEHFIIFHYYITFFIWHF